MFGIAQTVGCSGGFHVDPCAHAMTAPAHVLFLFVCYTNKLVKARRTGRDSQWSGWLPASRRGTKKAGANFFKKALSIRRGLVRRPE
jgi:hypothetical protein